jgi:hypothetical protein
MGFGWWAQCTCPSYGLGMSSGRPTVNFLTQQSPSLSSAFRALSTDDSEPGYPTPNSAGPSDINHFSRARGTHDSAYQLGSWGAKAVSPGVTAFARVLIAVPCHPVLHLMRWRKNYCDQAVKNDLARTQADVVKAALPEEVKALPDGATMPHYPDLQTLYEKWPPSENKVNRKYEYHNGVY